MEWSSLRHRQINEKMARLVDQLEICVTMTWFGMVANGTALTFPFSTNVNPGPGNKNHWFVDCVLERKITDQLTLGVELFHQTPDKIDGLQSTGFNVGGIYDFTDRYHFLLSLGRGLQHAKETNELSWYIGLQVTGGEEPPKAQEAAP